MPSTSAGVTPVSSAISSIASGGEPAVLVLREVRERQDRRLRARVLRDDLARRVARFVVGERHRYRSTSPMIGSMLDTIATASATRLSRTIGSIDCRL